MSREFVDRGDFHLLAKMPFRECIERESVEPTVEYSSILYNTIQYRNVQTQIM